ncbi:MAG TPA: ribonuclease Y [bacterium]|jgi:ribonuclease Y|nr:ribonuclease Y [bacterium]HOG38389.1 ribonuclease Y [bacterium]HQI03347.1 ribonuclease Y [bacterium]
MEIFFYTASAVILLVLGIFGGYKFRQTVAKNAIDSAERKSEEMIEKAKEKQQDILLQAKEKAISIIDEAKKEESERRKEISYTQKRLEERESLFDKKLLDLENKNQNLADKAEKIEHLKKEIKKIQEMQMDRLEKISKMTKDEAKDVLLKKTENSIKEDLVGRIKKLEQESNEELEKRARDLLSTAIQRCAINHATETTTTTVNITSDEMKGRIIGREGRNIRTIEKLTGVEIIIDDTPDVIVISGFNPIRRHLAKRAIDKLILDGRIHPGRIEQTIEEAKKELALDIKKAGEEAIYDVGIPAVDPKLTQLLGRLKYRTSYGQNQLKHSVEVAHLSALIAEELGADVAIAKKGGLFHDIGKALDHEIKGTHPEIGYDVLKKFGINEEVALCAKTHHDDNPATLESLIVKVADAISGARPGARKDNYENFLQRLDELEKIANSFEGVDKTYAIQAGREIRIFVKPEEIDDLASIKLAKGIAEKVEQELKYPGEIKVNVIRETRIIEYAR